MKRFLWVTCLCCTSALAVIGCGNDKNGGSTSEDGGMSNPEIDKINNDISDIQNNVGDLGDNVDDINGKIDGIQKNVGDVNDNVDDLASQITKLENPSVPDCSSNDPAAACKPDGIEVVSTDITKIVAEICSLEINCCSKSELALKFGAGIETVDECKSVFFDLLANGFSPDLFQDQYGYAISYVIQIAQALNDKRIKVSIDTKQVQACVTELSKRECPKFEESTGETIDHCIEGEDEVDDPCSPMMLVDGLQEAGEACDVGGLYGVPQCKDKLICRHNDETDEGFCATPAAAGDGCTDDGECDEGLFCNHATAKCQKLSDVGEPCAYIDPTFKVNGEYNINPLNGNSNATSIDCMPGLTCDPKSKKCVNHCSAGTLCYVYSDEEGGNTQCPDKMVCNVTENPDLYDTWNAGICRPAIATGKPCTNEMGNECASGNCGFNDDEDTVCLAALTADGGNCSADGQPDATCKSGFCNTKGKCAKGCEYDETTSKYVGCSSSEYCNTHQYTTNEDYACEPKAANGDDCLVLTVNDLHVDVSCTSGFCDPTQEPTDGNYNGKCAAKVAADAACASNETQQCPNTQWCSAATCAALIADGATCSTNAACNTGSYCQYNSTNDTNSCQPYADDGDTCDFSYIFCKNGLTCNSIQSEYKCHEYGKYPNGTPCNSDSDCAHGWCTTNTPSPVCATPIADGKACDSSPATGKDRCVTGDYCKFPEDDTAGKCAKRSTAGTKCTPRFNGADCLNYSSPTSNGSCTLSNDQFLCDQSALAPETLFCDGQ